MLGANAAAISHRPENSTAALSSGGSGAFLFSSQLSPALSVESSGSGTSTIKGIPEGKKHNRWSGSVSSLSRSNSDSSTLSKNRPAQHSYSASVPHIVGIRTERPNQASRTKISPHSIESKNGKVSSDKISTATQHNQSSQSQSARPPASLSKVQPKLPIAPRKNRQHRSLSQRAMLASALNKANAAVLLDSAGNIEGAIEAYGDACALLQQAVSRAEVEGDKAQLQSIHDTYINRIEQLRAMSPNIDSSEKQLPARPLAQESIEDITSIREEDEQLFDEDQYYGEEEVLGIYQTGVTHTQRKYPRTAVVVPPRRDSLFTGPRKAEVKKYQVEIPPPLPLKEALISRGKPPSPIAEDFRGGGIFERDTESRQSTDKEPLRLRGASPQIDHTRHSTSTGSISSRVSSQNISPSLGHSRGGSEVSTSWLNTIDESGGSASDGSIKGEGWRSRQGFEAELDAAVDAAYDDEGDFDQEVYQADSLKSQDRSVSGSLEETLESKLQRAKERVIQVEQEMQLEIDQDKERTKWLRERVFDDETDLSDDDILESVVRDYSLDDFEFDLQAKTSLPRDPRESSSSSMSASTWVSSVASKKSSLMSHGHISGTVLQSVAELPPSEPPPIPPPPPPLSELFSARQPAKPMLESSSRALPITALPPSSPPRTAPPPPPGTQESSPGEALHSSSLTASPKQSGVRMRRLSGLVAGPLVIETSPSSLPATTPDMPTSLAGRPSPQPPSMPPPSPPAYLNEQQLDSDSDALCPPAPSPVPLPVTQDPPPPVPLKTSGTVRPFPPSPLPGSENGGLSLMPPTLSNISTTPRSGSPARFAGKKMNLPGLRQINSSSSLKGLNILSTPDMEATSPITPGFGGFFNSGSATSLRLVKPPVSYTPTPPTPGGMVPMTPTIGYSLSSSAGLASGGLDLFDSKIHSLTTPGSPNSLIPNPPAPLEPCPTEALSRPFWLMRCLYQTVTHPRGGYITTRLFVPKGVWQQKGVKIKGVDDKISACDLVSAALAKLIIIQNGPGDIAAILEEMQSLEGVLDRVQAMLTKKLGNEVGAAGATALYGSGVGGDTGNGEGGKSSTGKSYLSWRKLRSKNSNTALASSFISDVNFETPSLPMATPQLGSDQQKPPERNLKLVSFTGPNAAYIAALARVFDAAQILEDRIAMLNSPDLPRKVQVGLEFSQRHTSEFFGLYICRFVLADLTMLLDKFIKKSTEWVGS